MLELHGWGGYGSTAWGVASLLAGAVPVPPAFSPCATPGEDSRLLILLC
jgi:hypothetical protein